MNAAARLFNDSLVASPSFCFWHFWAASRCFAPTSKYTANPDCCSIIILRFKHFKINHSVHCKCDVSQLYKV